MGRPRIYSLNENYFNIIDSNEKAYILGFIYADGSVFRNYLTIGLSDKDVEILEHIKKCLGYDGIIYKRFDAKKNKSYVILSVSSKNIVKTLIDLGVINNKTYLSKEFPTYEKKYEWAFLRGFFDGDGSIYCNFRNNNIKTIEYTVCFSGNLSVLNQLKKILYEYNISSSNIRHRRENEESCMLEIRGNNNIEKIYGLMYEDDGFYLKRKKNKFNDFNNMLTTLTKRNLSNKIIDDILEYYNMKIKQSEIANILKIPKSSVRTVIQRLRKNGKIV
jgi:hypothetical protein